MAVRVFQFSVVFAIGFCLGPVAESAVATGVTEIPLSLLLKDPEDVITVQGQSATLRCNATSTKPSTIYWSWFYEGNLIATNDTRMQVFNNGSLHIPKVTGKEMEGRYQCRAKTDIGAVISNPARLRIASIKFINQPSNISVAEEQPTVLFCPVQSVPNAVIRWEYDNKSLPHNTRYVPLPLGALLITSTHSSDFGLYRCVARNKILKKTRRSKIRQLTVLPPFKSIHPPKFLPLGIPLNLTVLVGDNLTLYCAVRGWPIPTVQWFKNMSVLMGNITTLELKNVNEDTAGNYSCSATNSGGYDVITYQVNIHQPPYFNVTPVSISYPPARTVRLDCQVKGIPQPKISWLKDGEVLQSVGRIKIQYSGLVLSHSFTTDAGVYQCVAENSAGRRWVSAQLTPYFSESRPSPPQNVQCRPFDESSICLVWTPPKNVAIQAYSIYGFSSVPTLGATTLDFVTNYTYGLASGLDSSTNYTFYVRSYSKEASDQSNNVSCQTGVKGERNLKVERVGETSVKLTWSNVSHDIPCGSMVTLYKIQWRRIDHPHSTNIEYADGLKKIISGLRPFMTYEFRVESSTNKNDHSSSIQYTLLNENIDVETTYPTFDNAEVIDELNNTLPIPQQVEASLLSPYSINLTWADVEVNENVFYVVCYLEAAEYKKCEEAKLIKSETNYLEVNNLRPNTKYEFKVRSEDQRGMASSFSHSVQIRTLTDVPSPVQDLAYKIINSSAVCIRWRAPLHKNGKLIKYMLLYTSDQNRPLEQWYSIEVPASQAMIKNCWPFEDDAVTVVLSKLQSHAQYTVLVRAATEAGLSNPTIPLTFAIKDELPSDNSTDDIYNKQKLGIALGVSISILCIICCLSGVIFKKHCAKRDAMLQARNRASNNYYPSSTGPVHAGTSLQLRHQESCSAEAHEMQHLVSEDCQTRCPPLTPAHLDTKGGVGFPNGQLNGSLKHAHINGNLANGHVHITENPRYDYNDCNGYVKNPRRLPKQATLLPTFKNSTHSKTSGNPVSEVKDSHLVGEHEDMTPYNISQASIVNLPEQCSKYDEILNEKHRLNGKVKASKLSDYNSNCNRIILSEDDNIDVSENSDLNTTQLTCLDESLAVHNTTSPTLEPNG